MVNSRLIENLLTVAILGFMGWIVYVKIQGNDALQTIKDKFKGGENGRFKLGSNR